MIDLDMSPYAAFVWPAWAITVVVLGAVVVRAVAASRRWTAELKRLEDEAETLAQVAPRAVADPGGPQAAQGALGPQG